MFSKFRKYSVALLALSLCGSFCATAIAKEAEKEPWWKQAVVYEIYPRSFADADNNGVGEIKGITSKLDYLKDLGVDALWITPCYPSPQVDFGYDISDYKAIAPEYGTMADFDELLAEAKKRDIKIIMDFVMNHSSDKHPWFVESASSKDNAKRDWYIWRDGVNGAPPNNWISLFGHSAWKLYPETGQYNYHFFYPEQPDLNWRNSEMRKAMYDAARFWLDKGVAGFRLDAVQALFEDPKLPDNPVKEGKNQYGDPNTEYLHNDRLPEVHDVLRELRAVLDMYPGDRVLIGETTGSDIAEISKSYGKNLDEVQLPMNFIMAYINKLSAPEFRKRISEWDKNPAGGWPLYFFSNHDQVRHFVRYGDKIHNEDIAKLTAAVLMTVRGTPMMYYGEELGMQNNDPKTKEDVQDPIGKIGWPAEIGRDGERTPMQWNSEINAGFSKAKPWLPVSPDYKKVNVASEDADKNSVLNFYKQLIHLRKTEDALKNGSYETLDDHNPDVLSYLRKSKDEIVVVALNMTPAPKFVQLDLSANGISADTAEPLLASFDAGSESLHLKSLKLPAYGVLIGKVN